MSSHIYSRWVCKLLSSFWRTFDRIYQNAHIICAIPLLAIFWTYLYKYEKIYVWLPGKMAKWGMLGSPHPIDATGYTHISMNGPENGLRTGGTDSPQLGTEKRPCWGRCGGGHTVWSQVDSWDSLWEGRVWWVWRGERNRPLHWVPQAQGPA